MNAARKIDLNEYKLNTYERELKGYRTLNEISNTNGVVLFGSTFAKEIPVGELKQSFEVSGDIYNRSISDLSVFDAENLVDDCVNALCPKKVLVQLGETDLERGFHTVDDIVSAYERLIGRIKKDNKHCKIVVVSVCLNSPSELNRRLEALAKKMHCTFADITRSTASENPQVKAFSLLKCFFSNRVSFSDAMSYNACI